MVTTVKRRRPPVEERQPGDPWTLEEAARRLRVSLSTLTRMVKAGTIRVVRPSPRRVLVPDAEVNRVANGTEC